MPASSIRSVRRSFSKLPKRASRLRLLNFILAFALIGTIFLHFSLAATAGFYGSMEQDQMNRINSRRASIGRASLQHIECLNAIAEIHAKEMADKGGIYHTSYTDFTNRVQYACGGDWSILGENVGVGYTSAGIFDAFMGSTGHRTNIDDSRFAKAGIGAYVRADGTVWITQLFANCGNCTSPWSTNATLPTDPVNTSATATGNGYFLRNSNTGGSADFSFNYGISSDLSVFCDWNGDGKDSAGVFRKGIFYLSNDNQVASLAFSYGISSDVPVCGDWNGDGIDTIGVYRPNESTFYLRNSNSSGNGEIKAHYGVPGDKPIIGDWDGNGTDTIGIVRGTSFYLRNSNTGGAAEISFGYGAKGDVPVVGDWDGNGTDTPGVWRKGAYYLRNSNTGGSANIGFSYGIDTDLPVVGDWDGNKTATIGVRR